MPDYLVVLDIPSIKQYVFMTHKLKEIQGASIILDKLNRIDFYKQLATYLPSKKIDPIYANGGSAMFVVSDMEEVPLQMALAALEGHVKRVTCGGASIVWGLSEYKNDFNLEIKIAHFDLSIKRHQSVPAESIFHSPFSKECDSCSRLVAISDIDEDWLCPVCKTKRDFSSQRTGIWQEFNNYLSQKFNLKNPANRPTDFSEIGKACDGDFLAIVYADGNSIGRLIREINTKKRFKNFAQVIDSSIKLACFDALTKIFLNIIEQEGNGNISFPADILLLGGDDLLVALPGDKALSFAYNASIIFESLTKKFFTETKDNFFNEKLGGMGSTISFGIALGKSHYPFRVLLSQAEELLRCAKIAGSQDPDAKDFYIPSYLDFHLSSQSHQLNIPHIREIDYSFERNIGEGTLKYSRTFRPYKTQDLKKLFDVASNLKAINFPKTKLNGLYRAAMENRSQSMLETIRIATRCKEGERKVLLEALELFDCRETMPWSPGNRTFVTELVEFYEFMS
ncbi:MAG: hypothetical protein A2Y79_11050 [Deltaproteobacteria bacterium RBG_13_43_22]|nr:MAG: hypothetical protein A2Y79_11050 [Deltaproteobacteria bacterium RBG_13_43_22]